MNRSEILYEVQGRLIDDLGSVVKGVNKKYSGDLNNAWVFDQLDIVMKSMKPAKIDDLKKTNRKSFEAELSKMADENLSMAQEHIPEITSADVKKMIKLIGSIYESLSKRAEAELKRLEACSSKYKKAKDLVAKEFPKSKAFKSKAEHEKWLKTVTKDLGTIFDYIGSLGETLAGKSGFMWNIKLTAAKSFLNGKLGIDLDLDELNADIKVAKKAIITSYEGYEKKLITSRYA
ncbi:MAG: hypothetical protein COB53_10165 [Elusimicrobia bacterium]|nr:MAG: hypothetical protein COB53_10165 [Elusimicrobiota bacterium]